VESTAAATAAGTDRTSSLVRAGTDVREEREEVVGRGNVPGGAAASSGQASTTASAVVSQAPFVMVSQGYRGSSLPVHGAVTVTLTVATMAAMSYGCMTSPAMSTPIITASLGALMGYRVGGYALPRPL
jgi:hypothetical protein